jgi:membrane protein DedA with SNARE-associated domain
MYEYVAHTLAQISEFSFITALIAPIIGGEPAVIALAFLAGGGTFSLWQVIAGSFFGMLILDMGWFLFLRHSTGGWRKYCAKHPGRYRKLLLRITTFTGGNDVLVLFVSKVLWGTRILTLAYLSVRNLTFLRFLWVDAIATFFWALILGFVGFCAGRGYINAAQIYESGALQFAYLIAILGLAFGGLMFIRKQILSPR